MDDVGELIIPVEIWLAMQGEVDRWAPEEACGLLAGTGRVVQAIFPISNLLHSSTGFRMDPQQQVRAFIEIEQAGMELIAIYHSHPTGSLQPSQTDLAEFAYPGVAAIIWGSAAFSSSPSPPGFLPKSTHSFQDWSARAFFIEDQSFHEIGIHLKQLS